MKKYLPFLTTLLLSPAHSHPQVYVELQGGLGGMYSKYYAADDAPYNSVDLRDGLSYRGAIGWLNAHAPFHYGVEVGYASYPTNQYTYSFPTLEAAGVLKYTGHNIDLLGVLQYNLHALFKDKLYLQGKAGVARLTQTFNGQASAFDTSFALVRTVSQYRPEIALGVGYQLSHALTLDVAWHHIFASRADPSANATCAQNTLTQLSSINTLMAGITYRFL